MTEQDRSWEAWDDKVALQLSKNWSNLDGNLHGRIAHKAASLIVGNEVLDVGCGIGSLFSLVKNKDSYLGVDTSLSMLQKAREAYPLDAEKFCVGDAYDLSAFAKADTVTAIGLILHLPNPEKVIEQLCSRAKRCVVMTACIGDTSEKRLTGMGKGYFILRQDTIDAARTMIAAVPNVSKTEEFPFINPIFGSSNYFFRIWVE